MKERQTLCFAGAALFFAKKLRTACFTSLSGLSIGKNMKIIWKDLQKKCRIVWKDRKKRNEVA